MTLENVFGNLALDETLQEVRDRLAPEVVHLVGSNSGTATRSDVAGSATNVTLLASNANRKGATIINDSSAILYVKFGATATATDFTYKLAAGDTLELPTVVYTGRIDGIWSTAAGSARITELT